MSDREMTSMTDETDADETTSGNADIVSEQASDHEVVTGADPAGADPAGGDVVSADQPASDPTNLGSVEVVQEEAPDDPWTRPGAWYVVHTQSGYEKKVTANLHARIQSMNMDDHRSRP